MSHKHSPDYASRLSKEDAAQRLRKASTDAERKLWQLLRNRQLRDWKFRRQVPIRNYIVDFACFDAKLIIEVDGGHHQEQSDYDDKRTKALMDGGFKVLRFWNNQVLAEIDSVQDTIVCTLESTDASGRASLPD